MSVILLALGLSLLTQGCMSSADETQKGCRLWHKSNIREEDVCCESCFPGNRLVRKCGPNLKDLCTPCETNTYTVNPTQFSCTICTQCIEPQILMKSCTSTTDTVCKCATGLRCGDDRCSFCVKECNRGEEPTKKRSCRLCPSGTFNDQIHQKCKPWRTKCPDPAESIVASGTAFSDIKCQLNDTSNLKITLRTTRKETADAFSTPELWPVVVCVTVMGLVIMLIIISIASKMSKNLKKSEKTTKTTTIIRTPTDDPRTLIAVECSFHEAEQENGSSSESLNSKDSKYPLIM